jgi:hypothetical protein
MATAKKVNKAEQVRAYQAKNPDASAMKVAKACKTNPAYVYAIRASDKGKAAKTPKVVTHLGVTMAKDDVTKLSEEQTARLTFNMTQGRTRMQEAITMIEPQADRVEDHPLYAVFVDAIKQAMHGKGERHGGARTPFLEQPWAHYTKMHGRGFATGQATKKLEEAASTRNGEAFEQEVFGAIVYAGMAILKERGQV